MEEHSRVVNPHTGDTVIFDKEGQEFVDTKPSSVPFPYDEAYPALMELAKKFRAGGYDIIMVVTPKPTNKGEVPPKTMAVVDCPARLMIFNLMNLLQNLELMEPFIQNAISYMVSQKMFESGEPGTGAQA